MDTGESYHISYIRRQFHNIVMIFLPVFLYNSFLFPNFAIKYWPMVVNDPSTTCSLSVGWWYDIEGKTITALADYSVHLET